MKGKALSKQIFPFAHRRLTRQFRTQRKREKLKTAISAHDAGTDTDENSTYDEGPHVVRMLRQHETTTKRNGICGSADFAFSRVPARYLYSRITPETASGPGTHIRGVLPPRGSGPVMPLDGVCITRERSNVSRTICGAYRKDEESLGTLLEHYC